MNAPINTGETPWNSAELDLPEVLKVTKETKTEKEEVIGYTQDEEDVGTADKAPTVH